jgi:hypothetical protein
MLARATMIPIVICQWSMTALWSDSAAAATTYTCESVFFRAEAYADDTLPIDVQGDDIKKLCVFVTQHDDPLRVVSCNAVDTLAQVQVPKTFVINVFELGLQKICQFSINGA